MRDPLLRRSVGPPLRGAYAPRRRITACENRYFVVRTTGVPVWAASRKDGAPICCRWIADESPPRRYTPLVALFGPPLSGSKKACQIACGRWLPTQNEPVTC